MYLRRVRVKDGQEYILRESRWCDGCWRYRDLLRLGADPRKYILYPGGNGFYFTPEIEDALQTNGVSYCADDMEDIFLPFLKPHIQRVIGAFRRSGSTSKRWSNLSDAELLALQNKLHSFDKRRLHYLRCGRVDMGTLDGRAWKFLNVLLGKSRDEIEHTIEDMEAQLRPREIRSYLYTSLHLQRYFAHRLTRHEPVTLDPEAVDARFMEELCGLNEDSKFFMGVDRGAGEVLHPYLARYAVLYFDNEFERSGTWTEYARFTSRQFPGAGAAKTGMPTEEACRCLGICAGEFATMSRPELARHYRRLAKKLHPDGGGDHDAFIRMTEAYESLISKK